MTNSKQDPTKLSSLLPIYYDRLFPYKHYYQWLCYNRNPLDYFARREIAFICNRDGEEVHLRYRSFDNQRELETAVRATCPDKIDVGAVFNAKPREYKHRPVVAVEREIVFDIDLTDYDDIRTCCKEAGMCHSCWVWIIAAVKVVSAALIDDFDLHQHLWVYSGRRGIHCWVADECARQAQHMQRAALADYLNVLTGDKNTLKRVRIVNNLHPSLQRAYAILTGNGGRTRDYFIELCVSQGWLDTEYYWQKFIKLATHESTREMLTKTFALESFNTPQKRYRALQMIFDPDAHCLKANVSDVDLQRLHKNVVHPDDKFLLHELVLQFAYPRLDINVTKGVNHLLKSPFCVHPKTGKIAVPLNTRIIDTFNISAFPTLAQLVDEIGQITKDHIDGTDENCKMLDYKRTSLADYVDTFVGFVQSIREQQTSADHDVKPNMQLKSAN